LIDYSERQDRHQGDQRDRQPGHDELLDLAHVTDREHAGHACQEVVDGELKGI